MHALLGLGRADVVLMVAGGGIIPAGVMGTLADSGRAACPDGCKLVLQPDSPERASQSRWPAQTEAAKHETCLLPSF